MRTFEHQDEKLVLFLREHAQQMHHATAGACQLCRSGQRACAWIWQAACVSYSICLVREQLTTFLATLPVMQVDPRFANSLPDAPDGCSAALRSKIAWGVATSAYQVRTQVTCRKAAGAGAAAEAAALTTMSASLGALHLLSHLAQASGLAGE